MVGIVLGGGGSKDGVQPPALSNPAVAGNVLKDKDFINALNERVVGTIISKAAQNYTPSTAAQTIAAGQYLSGAQTISAVPTQSKTVTPSTSAQTIKPDTGKFLSQVIVNAANIYVAENNYGSYLQTLTEYIPFYPSYIAIISQEDTEDVAAAMGYRCAIACFWGSDGQKYAHISSTGGTYLRYAATWDVQDSYFSVTITSNTRFSGKYLIIATG